MRIKRNKQYSVLMTEHEKRVNDKDIRAFQHSNNNLHSKVIGFSGDDRLDKYIDKSMGVNSNYNSPNQNSAKGASIDASHPKTSNSNLAKMGQMSLNKSTNILTDQPDPPRNITEQSYPITKLLKVRDNMEKEDAIKFRANTNNRGYGFVQSVQRNSPLLAQPAVEDKVNPYEYNYTAPGNY